MSFLHKEQNQFNTTKWSGGDTTELLIWPKGSIYAKRDFEFRLSTATVEIEASLFTPLNGVDRTLMVLDGEMKLIHENQHEKSLKKFDIDCFKGDWKTKSIGKCRDFNLMTCGDVKGEVEGIELRMGDKLEIDLTNKSFLFLYVLKGSLSVVDSEDEKQINKGDLIGFESKLTNTILLNGLVNTDFVRVDIRLV